jgi:hypothetical protein
MDKKIKVALCLSGEPRNSMFCYPYIYESLIDLGPNYQVDIYVHTWKYFRALPLYKPSNYVIDWINEDKFYQEFLNTLTSNTTQYPPEMVRLLDDIAQNSKNTGILKNTLLMYLSLQKCFNLIKKPYDVYLRGRFDFYFSHKLYIQPHIKSIINQQADIIVPLLYSYNNDLYNPQSTETLFNDQLAICNLKGAEYYFNIYNNIFDIILKSKKINPHYYLKEYLNKSNLNVVSFSHGFENIDLVRSSRVITRYNSPYLDN